MRRRNPQHWLSNSERFILVAASIVQYIGTGRRKESVARVILRPGKGDFTINGRAFENYFSTEAARASVRQPLLATETARANSDILMRIDGGGSFRSGRRRKFRAWHRSGARCEFNVELRSRLKKLGFLTRDPRQHERKKYGQKGARKRFQFSKR